MHIDPTKIIKLDLEGVAGMLQPVVFAEGDGYCCLLGQDPQSGVMGCGETPKLAVEDWDARLRGHLAAADDEDYIVQFVKSHISPSVEEQTEPTALPPFKSQKLNDFLKSALRPPSKRS